MPVPSYASEVYVVPSDTRRRRLCHPFTY